MITKIKSKLVAFKNNKQGSETVEFLGSFGWLLLAVMTLIMLLAYVYSVSQLNYVCRRVVRAIEITGTYNATNLDILADKLFPGDNDVTIEILYDKPLAVSSKPDGEHIQLRDTFTVTLKSTYALRMFSSGIDKIINVPLSTSVQGMSEVYQQP